MSDARLEVTWDDLGPEPPLVVPPPGAPAAAPSPPPPRSNSTGPGGPGPPRAAPAGQGSSGPQQLPPVPVPGPRAALGRAAPAWSPSPGVTRSPNRTPLIIGGVIAVALLVVLLVNTVGNDEPESLSAGESTSGSVGGDDADRFRIEGRGAAVFISVTGEDGFDPTVSVQDASGVEVGYDDDSGGGLDSYLELYLDSGSAYTIEVEGFSGSPGSYRIWVG